MQNPFTTTFSKTPEYTYIHTEKTEEILENFVYENPSESVYKITGVRGSGKTVILAKVEEELKNNENRYINWLVFDVNPTRDNNWNQYFSNSAGLWRWNRIYSG